MTAFYYVSMATAIFCRFVTFGGASNLVGRPGGWTVSLSGHISDLQVNVQRRSLAPIASTLQRARARVKIVGCIRFCGDRDGRTVVRSYGTKKLYPSHSAVPM